MKKKILGILISGLFLFGIGVNNVKADDPAGESTTIPGQAEEAPPVEDNSGVSEESNNIPGQAEEAPPVEDNSGVSGESTIIPGQAEEAPPVQLVEVKTEFGIFYLSGIDGTVKDKKYILGNGNNSFLVLTTDSKLYYGVAEAGSTGNKNVTMKKVSFTSTITISKLTIIDMNDYYNKTNNIGNYLAVKLENGKVYSVLSNNGTYYVDTSVECVEDSKYKDLNGVNFVVEIKQLTSITNKESNIKAILSADEKNFNDNSSLLVKVYNNNEEHYKLFESAIKKLLGNYSKIKLFNIKLSNVNDDGPLQPSSKVKIVIPIPDGYDKNNLSIYHLEDNGDLEKIDSTIDGNNIVFYANHFSLYGIVETNGKQNTITNPKTGNYLPYTFGLLFIIISSVGLFALKNRKVFNK